jgi:polyhydroxyalkanoate synthesis regulator phasin
LTSALSEKPDDHRKRREPMLEETMKKILLAGLGGVVITGEKLEALKSKLMKENKMSEREAKGLIDELTEAGETQWKEFEKTAKNTLRKQLDTMDVPDRKELEILRDRVESLERRVSALETAPLEAPEPSEPV